MLSVGVFNNKHSESMWSWGTGFCRHRAAASQRCLGSRRHSCLWLCCPREFPRSVRGRLSLDGLWKGKDVKDELGSDPVWPGGSDRTLCLVPQVVCGTVG